MPSRTKRLQVVTTIACGPVHSSLISGEGVEQKHEDAGGGVPLIDRKAGSLKFAIKITAIVKSSR